MTDDNIYASSSGRSNATNNNNNNTGGDDDWCTIESDPGVFTEILEMLGCTTVELSELYSLDDDTLIELQRTTKSIYGLIFLFQWQPTGSSSSNNSGSGNSNNGTGTISNREPLDESEIPDNVFFAQQVTTNACATQAILSVLFNATNNGSLSSDELGTTLSEFYNFVQSFPPHLKGIAISSSDDMKKAHNTFKRPDSFLITESSRPYRASDIDKAEVFHFVAYVPIGNTVYELDGLQKGPIVIGQLDTDTTSTDQAGTATTALLPWLSIARDAIQERMIQAGEDNVKFNLMAVLNDKRIVLQEQFVPNEVTNMAPASMTSVLLEQEHMKREQWKIENQRRRHNYIPFCIQLLKELAAIPAKEGRSTEASSSTTDDKNNCLLESILKSVQEKRQQQRDNRIKK